MTFDRHYRSVLLEERAGAYIDLAIQNVTREFPVSPHFVADGPGPYPTHREMHPAFYGSFDWHSCVEMVWVAVVLAHRYPESPEAVQAIDSLLTPEAIAGEVAFFSAEKHRSIERPYGWGWLLALSHELNAWNDPAALRWQRALQPLADLLTERFIAWLPRLTYAQRTGLHPNTAFAIDHPSSSTQSRKNLYVRGNMHFCVQGIQLVLLRLVTSCDHLVTIGMPAGNVYAELAMESESTCRVRARAWRTLKE
jgi:hypothetical protein